DWQTRVCEDVLALLDIGAFKANDERNREIHFLRGRNDTFGDDVAFHDPAEDVHEDALDSGVLQNDLEGGRDLFLARAAADIEEVRREGPIELDDIHRRHRETGAVDHAADVTVEL